MPQVLDLWICLLDIEDFEYIFLIRRLFVLRYYFPILDQQYCSHMADKIAQNILAFLELIIHNPILYYFLFKVPANLARRFPHLAHVESTKLCRPNLAEIDKIWGPNQFDWRQNYALHTWYRIWENNSLYHGVVEPNPETIRIMNNTLGKMARTIYYGQSVLMVGNEYLKLNHNQWLLVFCKLDKVMYRHDNITHDIIKEMPFLISQHRCSLQRDAKTCVVLETRSDIITHPHLNFGDGLVNPVEFWTWVSNHIILKYG